MIGARNAQAGNFIGGKAGNGLILKANITFFGSIEASDTVEKGGFAGTIGANDALDRAFGNVNGDGIDRHQTAKTFGYFCCG